MKVSVRHWRYEDGWRDIPTILRKPGGPERKFDANLIGWFCWVYTDAPGEFENWIEDNLQGNHDIAYRFNSGDPMFTLSICDDHDASLFKLTWVV